MKRLLVLLALLCAAAAACGGGSSGGAGPTTSPVTTPTHTHHPHPSPTVTPPVSPSPSAPAAAGCTTGQLQLSLGAAQGAAGTTFQPVVFTNTGGQPCTLFGYPGVSFVDSGGAQLGQPATHDSGAKHVITLAAGGTASATLREPNAGNFDPAACHETTASRLKVYPPNQTGALLVHDAAQICTGTAGGTGISPVHAGSNG